MVHNTLRCKLVGRFPRNERDQDHFELEIGGTNFLHLDFVSLSEEDLKTLQGELLFNDIEFIEKGSSFEWNSQVAKNRIVSKLGED